jgi:hypothetical protein
MHRTASDLRSRSRSPMAHAEGVDGAPSPEGAGAGSWLRNTMLSESRAKVEDSTHVLI